MGVKKWFTTLPEFGIQGGKKLRGVYLNKAIGFVAGAGL